MRTVFVGIFILTFCWACTGGRDKLGSKSQRGETLDSIGDEMEALSVDETVIPKNADELFDDFIYNYAANEKLQKARTVFPLPYIKEGEQSFIEEKDWKHDYLFTKEVYYTLLYDKEEDMDLETKVSIDSVTVEWIYLDTREIRQYHFKRMEGLWKLNMLEHHSTLKDENEEFLEFFYQFSNDSIFQRKHIHSPLKFVTPDPDDEFQILETTLELDQWFAFRPILPTTRMTNINYGQTYSKKSRRKIIDLRGIGNGFNNTLVFKRISGEWKLIRFEDLSN